MNTIRKKLASLFLCGSVALTALVPATAHADNVTLAVHNAVAAGKTTKKVKAFGKHEFNIKPPSTHEIGQDRLLVFGVISHHLRLRHDDDYYYQIQIDKQTGRMVRYSETIHRGGVGIVRSPIPVDSFVRALSGNRLTSQPISDLISYPNQKVGKWLNGSWEGSARKITLLIGAEVADELGLAPGRPKPRPAPTSTTEKEPGNHVVVINSNVRDHRSRVVVRDHRN